MATARMSFSYPQDQRDFLKRLAQKDARSLSSYIQMILKEHIEQKKKESRIIRK